MQVQSDNLNQLIADEILLYANPRMPIKIGCRRLAVINSEGCDLCCIP
jgi:hypothetical protein